MDSLQAMDYLSLYKRIRSSEKDSFARATYLKAYLDKARSEQLPEKIVQGYKHYLNYTHGTEKLHYADSMILAAGSTNDPELLGSAHLSIGGVYYNLKDYKNALAHYLKADRNIVQTESDYLKNKLKYNMGLVKYRTR